ncbi:MAG: hypothetical protein ABS62_12050 [Microbacterium sp. SCN 70-200]|uniref:hypothetical protein n=1 Tax=unclassified Microbacterium TaxID=2609290 RepID=UPI00086AB070|nr:MULTISPECIES: hypothetical protein [unclassified Microbacterium]MBN9216091.1 hypothetical protein [Microbacterium sp.]ODT39830.1 MAG: hypothetical protein ABS62_12050 [Microbacterium sp. SCN 70-200]OJV80569.1 MAG: hypothetical protein BGO46_01310 [Microbacterium sp. 70-16]
MAGLGRPGLSRGGVIVSVIGVVVLTIAVGALSVLAYQRTQPTDAGETARPAPTFTFGTDSTATPSSTPAVAPAPGAEERFLSVGASAMWRATAGECGVTAPVIERSGDEGETWADVTPLYQDIAQVRALTSFGGVNATAISDIGDACATTALRTFTDGRFWEPNAEVFATATYAPRTAGTVVVTGADVAAPCPTPWAVRASGTTTVLICDGTAYLWGGNSWQALTTQARAITVDSAGVVVGHVTQDCAGLQLTRFAESETILGCVEGDVAGEVAIDLDGDEVVVWSAAGISRTVSDG